MNYFVNTYTATTNSVVVGSTEEEIYGFMVSAASKETIDKYISYAIRYADPNTPDDDEWYAYHSTLKAISSNKLKPDSEGVYTHIVRYAAPNQVNLTNKPLVSKRSADDIAITVTGTYPEIRQAHDQLVVEGPWRDSNWATRPVYEDTYSVLDWKKDRPDLIDRWGTARYENVYPLWQQNRDTDILMGLMGKLVYDIYKSESASVPPISDKVAKKIGANWVSKHSLSKQVYMSGQVEDVQEAIANRKQAAMIAYNEVTAGVIEVPGL